MAAAAFADSLDIAYRLGRDLTDAERESADAALIGATNEIRAVAAQQFDQVAAETVTLRGSWDYGIRLPERPVTTVTTVTLFGSTLTKDADWYWPGVGELILRGPKPPVNSNVDLFRAGYHWGGPHAPVAVTYTHGYAAIPPEIVGVCISAATRVLVNPEGLESETITNYSVRYHSRVLGGQLNFLSAEEVELVENYRYKTGPRFGD